MAPLVSVITPTWQRHDVLVERCIPSVLGQSYPEVEHVIVSDGPDEVLSNLRFPENVLYAELPEHDAGARWGHFARLHGIEIANGDLIAYLDDDNGFRPDHIRRLAVYLRADESIGFAYSRVQYWHGNGKRGHVIGKDPPGFTGIDTSAIMHRRKLLEIATWRDDRQNITVDWDLVERWMAAGITWRADHAVTADFYA